MTAPTPEEVSPEVRVDAFGVVLYMWRKPQCEATKAEILLGVDMALRVRGWHYQGIRDGYKGRSTGRQQPDYCMVAMHVASTATCSDEQFGELVAEFKRSIEVL
jgi:hypothetical protein